jgi:hypothetical protein
MTLSKLKSMQSFATPGKLHIRQHSENESMFFLEASTYEGHPYHNVASGFEIGGEEYYPTKRADLELICGLWNALVSGELEKNPLAEKYRKLVEGK